MTERQDRVDNEEAWKRKGGQSVHFVMDGLQRPDPSFQIQETVDPPPLHHFQLVIAALVWAACFLCKIHQIRFF